MHARRRMTLVLIPAVLGWGGIALAQSTPPKGSKAPQPPVSTPGAPAPKPSGKMPMCRDVGGYRAYLKRTGKICLIGAEGYQGGPYRLGR